MNAATHKQENEKYLKTFSFMQNRANGIWVRTRNGITVSFTVDEVSTLSLEDLKARTIQFQTSAPLG